MQPQFDVLSSGWRQPGSAFKPFNYATGIDDAHAHGVHDAHGRHHRLRRRLHAHRLQRPGARSRCASATRSSSRSTSRPSRRSRWSATSDVFERGPGVRHATSSAASPRPACRWPWAPWRSTRSTSTTSYATLANGGRNLGLTVDPVGHGHGGQGRPAAVRGRRRASAVISEQAAYVITDILAGNTDPAVNPIWAAMPHHDAPAAGAGRRRSRRAPPTTPRTSTPTATSRRPRPRAASRASTRSRVGVWAGNSDSSPVDDRGQPGLLARRRSAHLGRLPERGHARLGGATTSRRPDGLSTASVDVFTGYKPSPGPGSRSASCSSGARPRATTPTCAGVEVVRGRGRRRRTSGRTAARASRARAATSSSTMPRRTTPAGTRPNKGWIRRARRGAGVGADVSTRQAHLHGLLLRALLPALRAVLGRTLRADPVVRGGAVREPQRLGLAVRVAVPRAVRRAVAVRGADRRPRAHPERHCRSRRPSPPRSPSRPPPRRRSSHPR